MPKWTDNPTPSTLRVRAWRAANPEKMKAQRLRYEAIPGNRERKNAYIKAHVDRRRLEMIKQYGGACVCCGETETVFLQFDHINNDGSLDRRKAGRAIYYKKPIQLLCANCNHAKRFGPCPHKRGEAVA